MIARNFILGFYLRSQGFLEIILEWENLERALQAKKQPMALGSGAQILLYDSTSSFFFL